MVAAMKSVNWRNSDCQFSMTEPQKCVERTYSHQEADGSPCCALVGVVLVLARKRLRDERRCEQAGEEERQAVLAKECPHGCVSATSKAATTPVTMMTA